MPHIHELIDFTVVAFVVHGNRVLLIYHTQLHKWLPLGGHIELDEDPEQALFREIKEESGLEVEILSQKPAQHFAGRKFLESFNQVVVSILPDCHSPRTWQRAPS